MLTKLLHDGAIWTVYVASGGNDAGKAATRLEFESRDSAGETVRIARPAEGDLLDALHRGEPVSRAALEEVLERATRESGAGGTVPPYGGDPNVA